MRKLSGLLLCVVLLAAVFATLGNGDVAGAALRSPDTIGWVGGLFPVSGSSNTIVDGTPFDVYVQVWESGVTEPSGQGANISCTLHWGEVPSFGSSWTTTFDTPMTYNTDVGNNDEYMATVTPGVGLYEFTAFCTDLDDGGDFYSTNPSGNVELTVTTSVSIEDSNALWLDADTIAWNGTPAASYKLLSDPDGDMDLGAAISETLTINGTIDGVNYPQNPNSHGLVKLELPGSLTTADKKDLLKEQLVVAAYDGGGGLVAATAVQIQSVLDDLYASSATSAALGISYSGAVPTAAVWAPTAKSVSLIRYADATTTTPADTHALTLDPASGVWSVAGGASWDRQFYLFDVEVYVPSADQVLHNIVSDPYSVNLSMDSTDTADPRSQFVNLADADLKPAGWDSLSKPALAAPEDIAVYEVHVRDFSRDDLTVPASDRGTFKAFTHTSSDGMSHLLNLQDAGLTHIHLLPAFDIASVNEDASARTDPDPVLLATYGPASDQQQTAVGATRDVDSFNWGYDPYHYGVPEGSYSTDPQGTARILEFRQMVQTLNENDLRVVMDVVYNHTAAVGQEDKSVLDKVVPGYYYRYTLDGTLETSSCCADTASEYAMMEKLMLDTLARWATDYKVDGFRFDLMNLHTVQNAVDAQTLVQSIDPDIYVYGEGWDFGSAAAKGLNYAKQDNMFGKGIGTFNDRIRDAAHGGYSTDSLQIRHQGFINGLSYDWNGYFYNNRDQAALHYEMDRLRVALVGELSGYGNGSGYTADPQEAINYVSKHDNETLYDQNIFKLPWGEGGTPFTPMSDRVRAQNMGLSLTGLAQGIPFFQMGSDMLRSKSLDRNSYDSGDWFNTIDWTYNDNNFAKGLPPAWDNSSRWPIMTPLLSDTNLVPTSTQILSNTNHLDEILQIRASSPLFRLQTAVDAITRIQFHNAANNVDGLIVMSISDQIGTDLDANYEQIFVLFNADKNSHMFTIGSLADNMNIALHPVQASSADPVVQTAVFDDSTGTFTVPARTTAVFVDSSPDSSSSSIVLDGLRDVEYGSAIDSDPAGDLNVSSSATDWADLTNLYCSSDNDYLYVYADLPAYHQSSASGQIGLLLDAGSAAGGTADPWGNAITFAHSNLPDYAIRGNVVGNPSPPDDNNGWTELRAWTGSDWTAGGTNWGGISGGGLIGNKIAYANNQGVEFKISFSDISANPGDSINLQLFSTQNGATKGAYDTIPSDDQATGWDDATTLTQYVACELTIVGNELRFGDETAVPDTTGSFPLDLINADIAASGNITFTYDSTIGLSITGVNATPRTSGFSTLNFSQDMSNPAAVAANIQFSGGTLSSGSGSIFDLDYTVSAAAVAGSGTPLDLLGTTILSDSLPMPLTMTLSDGSFSIQAPGHEDETFVHLFEWQWNDIARECEEWLAPKGFTAVQVSPPMEHILAAAENYPWWQRYQPVSYLIQSRSGTRAEFDQMVQRCDAVGVQIYVDAVINHMTGLGAFASGTGSAGTTVTADQYGGKVAEYPTAPGQYAAEDFHMNPASATHCDHDINNFDDPFESYNCELLGLDDLDTAKTNVQGEIAGYLNDLVDNLDVAGLRIDAAKHMHPNDVSAILGQVNNPPFVFQEVIQSNLTDGSDYLGNGAVTEFNYSNTIGDRFINGNIAALQNMGAGWLPTEQAVVFTDNHDNQRGHGGGGNQIVDHQDGQVYNLANIFMLAWPYGYPKVMSSYYWDGVDADAGPPGSGGVTLDVFDGTETIGDLPAHCDDGSLSGTDWICEHRRVAIANMVRFRAVTAGEAVTDWWDDGNNQIGYGRNDKGYVAINRDNIGLTRTFNTSMAAGSYCDITKGNLTPDGSACTGPVITVEANGDILNQNVAAMDAFAMMDAARIGSCPATAPPADFDVNILLQGSDARLTWLPYGGPYDVRYSTSDPYFATMSGTQLLPVPELNVAIHENVTSIVSVNTYYRVHIDNCSGQNDSQRVGVFNFGLVAGD